MAFPAIELISAYIKIPPRTNDLVLAKKSSIPVVYRASPTHIKPIEVQPAPIAKEAIPNTDELYIEIINGCGPYWAGVCTGVYSTPSSTSTPVTYLRNGTVLKVSEKVADENGNVWYKIVFDEWLRYPQRIYTDWYIQGVYAYEFNDAGLRELTLAELKQAPKNAKRIVVDKSDQKLYAYDGEELFLESIVSTGTTLNPTPVGEFSIFRKTPTRYMQGPLPDIPNDIYDLPGVPWSLYFTTDGAAIHGTYWHNNFGNRSSHGCVNVPLVQARALYAWADLATSVTVQE